MVLTSHLNLNQELVGPLNFCVCLVQYVKGLYVCVDKGCQISYPTSAVPRPPFHTHTYTDTHLCLCENVQLIILSSSHRSHLPTL